MRTGEEHAGGRRTMCGSVADSQLRSGVAANCCQHDHCSSTFNTLANELTEWMDYDYRKVGLRCMSREYPLVCMVRNVRER